VWCDTCSQTFREEDGLWLFKNRVLRIFGPEEEDITGGWRKVHNEELCFLYLPNIISVFK
jgi:hypothetical protein